MLLSVRDIQAGYGRAVVLRGVSIDVEEGEIVSILGPNGAGKTTTLRTISGLVPLQSGTIHFAGKQWRSDTPEARASARLGHVPEGRGILRSLTVEENLALARSSRSDSAASFAKDLDNIYDILPALRDRPKIKASALSGGQQQMLAIGRALLGRPRLLIIDELSFGLAPIIVNELFMLVRNLREQGTTFLLVEQNAGVLSLSDRTYVLARGRITLESRSSEIVGSERLVRSYMGGDAPSRAAQDPNLTCRHGWAAAAEKETGMPRRVIYGILTAALIAAASGCTTSASGGSPSSGSGGGASPQGITKTEINLGTTLPLTGGAASSAASFKAGLEASIQEINKAGGINGRKINLTVLDDGFDPARSVANIIRLESQDKVFALDLPVGSAEIPGSFPLVKRTGMPVFGPYLPPDPNLPSVFELATPHEQQGQLITDWLAGKKLTKIAYIGQDNDYGLAVLQGVKDNAAKDGVTIVSTGMTETNSTDVSPAVLSVKAKNPQAVVLGTDNTQTALVLKQAAQLGWKVLMVGDSSAMNTGTSVATGPAGAAANGIYGAAVAQLPTGTGAQLDKFRAAMQAYEPSTTPDLYSLIAYATNQVLFHILTLMGNDLSWTNFQKTAESLVSYNTGLLPPITFGALPGGHTGSHGLLIAQYNNGAWTAVTGFMSAK